MRLNKLTMATGLSALLVFTGQAFANDSFLTFSTPTAPYTTETTNYGGGDASGNAITNLPPFGFGSALTESVVPTTWATWGSPPNTESAAPNVLTHIGNTNLTIDVSGSNNTVGFELEPVVFQVESVSASFYNGANLIDTLTLTPSGEAGALLFALEDTSGGTISSVVIDDTTSGNDGFALAQLRAGDITPEPSTFFLFGSGLLGVLGAVRRKIKA